MSTSFLEKHYEKVLLADTVRVESLEVEVRRLARVKRGNPIIAPLVENHLLKVNSQLREAKSTWDSRWGDS